MEKKKKKKKKGQQSFLKEEIVLASFEELTNYMINKDISVATLIKMMKNLLSGNYCMGFFVFAMSGIQVFAAPCYEQKDRYHRNLVKFITKC